MSFKRTLPRGDLLSEQRRKTQAIIQLISQPLMRSVSGCAISIETVFHFPCGYALPQEPISICYTVVTIASNLGNWFVPLFPSTSFFFVYLFADSFPAVWYATPLTADSSFSFPFSHFIFLTEILLLARTALNGNISSSIVQMSLGMSGHSSVLSR